MKYRFLTIALASLCSYSAVANSIELPKKGKESSFFFKSNKKPIDVLSSLDKTNDWARCNVADANKIMSLYDILDLALCHDPKVREKWLQLKQYEIRKNDSYADYFPTLEYQGGVSRQLSERSYEDYQGYGTTKYKQSSQVASNAVQMRWLLFDFGKREATVQQTKREYLVYKMLVRSDLQQMVLDVAQKYFNVLANIANLRAQENNEVIAKRSYEVSRGKRLGGVGVLSDELQAQSQSISSEYNRISVEGNLKKSMGELAILIGLSPDSQLKFADESLNIPENFSIGQIDELLATALQQHPRILMAKQQVMAGEAALNVAQRDNMPKFYLSGSVNYETYNKERLTYYNDTQYSSQYTIGEMLTLSNDVKTRSGRSANVGLNVQIPIFSGFRQLNKIRDSLNSLKMAENNRDKLEKEISTTVWQSYQQLQTATKNSKIAKSLLKTAKEAHRIADGRYRSGIGNILEVLNTQNALSQAEINSVQANVEWHLARLALASSLGMLDLDLVKNTVNK